MVDAITTECISKDPDAKVLELVEYDGEGTEWELCRHFTEWNEMEEWIYDKYPIDWFEVESLLVRSTHSGETEILGRYPVSEIVRERFYREARKDGEPVEFADQIAQAAVDEYLLRKSESWRYKDTPVPLYSEIRESLID